MERHLHGRETDHQKPRHENVGGGHETQVTEPHHPDGTPIQNYLSELWNLFQFLNPSLLGTFNSFMQKYIVPIEQNGDKERQRQPKQMITSYLSYCGAPKPKSSKSCPKRPTLRFTSSWTTSKLQHTKPYAKPPSKPCNRRTKST